jgi:hypothetical protein
MSSHNHFSCANQAAQRHEETIAIRRLIAVLERNLDPSITGPNTSVPVPPPNHLVCCPSHYCSPSTSSLAAPIRPTKKARKSKGISAEPKPETSKHKKSKPSHTMYEPAPTVDPYFTYIIQPSTQNTTPQKPKKTYTGPHPQCSNCHYHHPAISPCRLCTSCNRLGHLFINCRTHTTSSNPTLPIIRGCYICGDPTHFRKDCPLKP